jgi:cytochrome b
MIVALLLCVAALAVTGWLYTTDMFWGSEAVEDLHRALAWTLLALVSLHVIGVIFTSWRHRENLVKAMFDGEKAAREEA